MPPDDSITLWLRDLGAGDEVAAQRLWERYFAQMVRLAGRKLPPHARRVSDEEDVALSAFNSFCEGVEQGRFPSLNDRNDLWRLLVFITARKVQEHLRHQNRQKRGGGKVMGESVFGNETGSGEMAGINGVIGTEPTPSFALEVADGFCRLLERLDDDQLKQIALLKMEGYTVEEIAGRVGCARRAVERRLQLIRKIWSQDLPTEDASS